MNKKALSLLAFAAAALTACNVDDISGIENPDSVTFSISAELEQPESQYPETRAMTEQVLRLTWDEGDMVSVFNLSRGGANLGTLEFTPESAGSTEGTFTGSLPGNIKTGDQLFFVYPAQSNASAISDVAISFDNQDGKNPMFCAAAYSYYDEKTASQTKTTFRFQNSIVNLHLADIPSEMKAVHRVIVSGVSTNIRFDNEGKVVVDEKTSDIVVASAFAPSASGTHSMSFGIPESASAKRKVLIQKIGVTSDDTKTYGSDITSSEIEIRRHYNVMANRFIKMESDFEYGLVDNRDFVDLGLPSGTLWAKCNVGAFRPTQTGKHFLWGSTSESLPSVADTWVAPSVPVNQIAGTEYDAAKAVWGDSWKMPSAKQFAELLDYENCNVTEEVIDDVPCLVIVSKVNGNQLIIPFVQTYVSNGREISLMSTSNYLMDEKAGENAKTLEIFKASDTQELKYRLLSEVSAGSVICPIRAVTEPVMMSHTVEIPANGGAVDFSIKTNNEDIEWDLAMEALPEWLTLSDPSAPAGKKIAGKGSAILSADAFANFTEGPRSYKLVTYFFSNGSRYKCVTEFVQKKSADDWATLSTNAIDFPEEGGTVALSISTAEGVTWRIESSDWVIVNYTSGTGSKVVNVTADRRYIYQSRGGFVRVILTNPGSENQTETVVVNQACPMIEYVGLSEDSGANLANYHGRVDLGLSVKWASCNYGAATPQDLGDYGHFCDLNNPYYPYNYTGQVEDHDELGSNYSFSIFNHQDINPKNKYDYQSLVEHNYCDVDGNMDYGFDPATRWGTLGTFRTPTKAQWEELMNECTWVFDKEENGYYVYGKGEKSNNYIFLPIPAEFQGTDGRPYSGSYWTFTLCDNKSDFGAIAYYSHTHAWAVDISRFSTYMYKSFRSKYYPYRFISY